SFLARTDIGIILINQFIAEMIRHAIDAHMQSIPASIRMTPPKIPSCDGPRACFQQRTSDKPIPL
ncbi:hypothetical protein M9458_009071, partial [Cirrhinus mrigala]